MVSGRDEKLCLTREGTQAPNDQPATSFSRFISYQHQPIFLVSRLSPVIPTANNSPVHNIIFHHVPSLMLLLPTRSFLHYFTGLPSTPPLRRDLIIAPVHDGMTASSDVPGCLCCSPQFTVSLLRAVSLCAIKPGITGAHGVTHGWQVVRVLDVCMDVHTDEGVNTGRNVSCY